MKRTVVLLCAMALGLSFSVMPSTANTLTVATGNDDVYLMRNFQTGEIIENSLDSILIDAFLIENTHILDDIDMGQHEETSALIVPSAVQFDPCIIFGFESRQNVSDTTADPYSSIVHMQITFESGATSAGTGFMIAPNGLVTAGHCLYYEGHGWAKSITFYRARNGSVMPYPAFNTSVMIGGLVNEQFVYHGNQEYDYGIISFNKNVSTSYLKCEVPTSSLVGTKLTMAGYPTIAKGEIANGKMFYDSGDLANIISDYLLVKIDGTAGQSGGPIYNATNNKVYGIFTGPNNSSTNRGVRITPDLKTMIDRFFS